MLHKYYYSAGENADIRSFPKGSNKYWLHNESFYQEIKRNTEQVQEIEVWFLHFARTILFLSHEFPSPQGLTGVSYCGVVFMYRYRVF
jgi:hypothetical protein